MGASESRPECVIASQRVGAKRRPMTGSAKQSISAHVAQWIASSQALLAMTRKQLCFIGDISSQARRTRSGEFEPIGFMQSIEEMI
jgi:hypothetical protein